MIKFNCINLVVGRRNFVDKMLFGVVTLGAAGRLAWIINLCLSTLLGFPLTWQERCEEALGASILWEQSSL